MKTNFQLSMRGILIAFLICVLSACDKESTRVEKESNATLIVKNGRLIFKDINIFTNVLNQLKKISTEEEAKIWEGEYEYTSLRKFNELDNGSNHTAEMNLPMAYTTLLNRDREYVIGKIIVWFDQDYVHFIDNLDEDLLKKIKANPSISKNKAKITRKVVTSKTSKNARTGGQINGQTGDRPDARYQHEWLINTTPGGTLTGDRRKTVYEILSITVPTGPTPQGYRSDYTFYMNIKFEWWWSGRGWQPNASEDHTVTLNLSGESFPDCRTISVTPINFNETINTRGNVQKVLASDYFLYNSSCLNNGLINYYIGGSISTNVSLNGVYQYTSPYTVSGSLW